MLSCKRPTGGLLSSNDVLRRRQRNSHCHEISISANDLHASTIHSKYVAALNRRAAYLCDNERTVEQSCSRYAASSLPVRHNNDKSMHRRLVGWQHPAWCCDNSILHHRILSALWATHSISRYETEFTSVLQEYVPCLTNRTIKVSC
jgi:hypothetical protein